MFELLLKTAMHSENSLDFGDQLSEILIYDLLSVNDNGLGISFKHLFCKKETIF